MIESDEFYYCEFEGKRCYSKKDADIAIKKARQTQRKGRKVPVRSYFCNYCKTYHLTSKYKNQYRHKNRKPKKSV